MPDTDSINIDEIIANVAKKYKTIIKPDDELLAVVFLNESLLNHHFKLIQKEHRKLEKYFELLSIKQLEKTKEILSLTQEKKTGNSENNSSNEMQNYFTEIEKSLEKTLIKFNREFINEKNLFYKSTKRLKLICICSAITSFILSMLILASFFI